MSDEDFLNEIIGIRAMASSLVIRCDKAIKGMGEGKPPAFKKKKNRAGGDFVDRRNARLLAESKKAQLQKK